MLKVEIDGPHPQHSLMIFIVYDHDDLLLLLLLSSW